MQTKIRTDQVVSLNDGWIPMPDTYGITSDAQGLDVIAVANNGVDYLSPGMRVKVTQGGTVYYGIIHKVDNDVTECYVSVFLSVSSGTRNRLDGTTISNMYYSREKIPYGFPSDKSSWSVQVRSTSNLTQSSPTANTWYNLGSFSITIPLGNWVVGYRGVPEAYKATAANLDVFLTLSTANNSASDVDFTSSLSTESAIYINGLSMSEKNIVLTSETTYYLNAKTRQSSLGSISISSSTLGTSLIAKYVDSYL